MRATRNRWTRGVLAALAAAHLCGCPEEAAIGPSEPIRVKAQVLYRQIYDAGRWAIRVPYELAMPIILRAKLRDWVGDLDLDPAVRERVLARIDSPVLLDEIVPFLLEVKDTYAAPGEEVPDFESMLRQRYSRSEKLPGFEHTLFRWEPEESESAGAPLPLEPEMISDVVALYDSLYLGTVPAGSPLGDELAACERRTDLASLRSAVESSRPIVRALIERARRQFEPEGELGAAVDGVLRDEHRLETVTATAIEFLDSLVCRSYRSFAARLFREQQLREWMLSELEEPGGGALWSYLRHASEDRRYAVLVVVDGLQGHLMEALAVGDRDAPFLRAISEERQRGPDRAPRGASSRRAATGTRDFLGALSDREIRDERYLPFFRDLFRDDGGDPRTPWGIARSGISTTPTISVRNLPIVKTGASVAGPGGTGIPNFHFVDREHRRGGKRTGRPYYFYGNDAMRLSPLTREAGMRSLFDRMPTFSSFSCAAQYDEAAHFSIDALLNLGLGESIRDVGERLCVKELTRRSRNELRLRELRDRLESLRASIRTRPSRWNLSERSRRRDSLKLARLLVPEIAALEQRVLPELLVYYNPWPDHFAHFAGPFSDEIVAHSGELNRLDYWLATITRLYAAGGVEERTLFGMAGDHGLTPVYHLLNPEVVVFDALKAEGVELRLTKISSDEGEGPKLNNVFEPPSMRGFDVVVASTAGGNYMLDFFHPAEERWATQPVLSDLRRLPLLTPDREGKRVVIDVIAELLDRLGDSLDYLVVRESACDAEASAIRVMRRGEGELQQASISRRGDRIAYRFEGADLLQTDSATPYRALSEREREEHLRLRTHCLDASRADSPEAWCTESEWRLLTSFTPRPDSVVQLAHLYDVDRAGTVNLFPRQGVGYNSRVPGRHAGESFHEKDAFVGFWGAPVTRGKEGGRIPHAVNGSIAPTLAEYLRSERVLEGRDGWGFPSLAPDIGVGALAAESEARSE